MPRLLKLMFQVPMSSPQITRMLGFLSCASAGAEQSPARVKASAAEPRPPCQRARVMVLLSCEWLPSATGACTRRRTDDADEICSSLSSAEHAARALAYQATTGFGATPLRGPAVPVSAP